MGGAHSAHGLPARAGARTSRIRSALFALLLLALAAAGGVFPAHAAAGLTDTIDAALAQSGVAASGTAVYIWDLDAARLLYSRNSTEEFTPGSNMKLVTAAAALIDWGGVHRIPTDLYTPDVPVYESVLYGDVYLRGLGDPSLSTLAYQRQELDMTTASFEAFAKRLKKDGVRKIRGHVLGDASWFDKQKTVSTWKPGLHLECGPLSALSGNQGLENGNRVREPATWAATLCTASLRAAGIKVTGDPGSGRVPDTTRLLKRQYSAPLSILLKRMNKASDNFFAEMLLKGLGKDFYGEGSTAAGAEASREALRVCGVQDGTYVVEDGSGLSYGNRLTARGIVKLLGAMRQRDDFKTYYDSLAIAGKDGSLRQRMRGTAAAGNARAKTGTLNIASCLSGYVKSRNEHRVAFAILLNGDSVDAYRAWKSQDTIVVALADATLTGRRLLLATPSRRQQVASALEAVHVVGGGLQPGVNP